MNRDKLTPIELECNMGKDINGVEHRELWKAYDIDEVDALLAKKDKEIYNIKYSRDKWVKACNQKDKEIAELKQKLEDAQASMYADVVDANMKNVKLKEKLDSMAQQFSKYVVDANNRERKLKRALWLARAERAKEKISWFKLWNSSISTMNPEDGARQEYDKWKRNLGKFLKKAEEYK